MFYYRNSFHDAYAFSLAGMSVTASAGPYPIVPSGAISIARDVRANAGAGADSAPSDISTKRRNSWLRGLGRKLAWSFSAW